MSGAFIEAAVYINSLKTMVDWSDSNHIHSIFRLFPNVSVWTTNTEEDKLFDGFTYIVRFKGRGDPAHVCDELLTKVSDCFRKRDVFVVRTDNGVINDIDFCQGMSQEKAQYFTQRLFQQQAIKTQERAMVKQSAVLGKIKANHQ